MATTEVQQVREKVEAAKAASRVIARLSGTERHAMLMDIAHAIERRSGEILSENALDVADARAAKVATSTVDRLMLTDERLADIANGVRGVAGLPDVLGQVQAGYRRPNGIRIMKVRVPLGVIGVIYEGRPNVTSDAAAICLKSGNAVVLRGSRVAARSNAILGEVIQGALSERGLPPAAVTMLGTDRAEMSEMVRMSGLIDLVIPRGGQELKAAIQADATVPVIYAAAGNCHVYVDAAADLEMAQRITINAKVSRPSVCNAAETLLIHRDIALDAVPLLVDALLENGVELRVCPETMVLAGAERAGRLSAATEDDYSEEYLALIMAVKVVDSLEEAIAHVNTYGTGHSEAIVTGSLAAATEFQQGVESACVYVNASTRFTDGGEYGMGAEIGNSTQKLHARGPIGPEELTTYQYLVTGEGQVR